MNGHLPRFVLIGLGSTFVHVVVVILIMESAGAQLGGPYWLSAANCLAWALALTCSYWGHHRWTFRKEIASDHQHGMRMPRFTLSSLLALSLNVSCANLFHFGLGLHYGLATGVGVAISVITTYVLSRYWAFAVLDSNSKEPV